MALAVSVLMARIVATVRSTAIWDLGRRRPRARALAAKIIQ